MEKVESIISELLEGQGEVMNAGLSNNAGTTRVSISFSKGGYIDLICDPDTAKEILPDLLSLSNEK